MHLHHLPHCQAATVFAPDIVQFGNVRWRWRRWRAEEIFKNKQAPFHGRGASRIRTDDQKRSVCEYPRAMTVGGKADFAHLITVNALNAIELCQALVQKRVV